MHPIDQKSLKLFQIFISIISTGLVADCLMNGADPIHENDFLIIVMQLTVIVVAFLRH